MTPDAISALKKENTLMDILAAVAAAYAKATSETEDDDVILGSWAPHFEDYREVNDKIIEKNGLTDDEIGIADFLTGALDDGRKSGDVPAGDVADGFTDLFAADKLTMERLRK